MLLKTCLFRSISNHIGTMLEVPIDEMQFACGCAVASVTSRILKFKGQFWNLQKNERHYYRRSNLVKCVKYKYWWSN